MKTKNLSDWAVALTVILCSIVLLLALIFALSGKVFSSTSRSIHANFHDVTGVSLSATVKYAGATAGKVSAIRMLTPQERVASGDPLNAVEVTIALDKNVPALPSDITVSVAADTLLSDKFLLLTGGNPAGPLLADGATLQGITPVSFDQLARDVDGLIGGLHGLLAGTSGQSTGDVFSQVHDLLMQTAALIAQAKPVLTDAGALTSDARQLITENRAPITRTVNRLEKAAGSLDDLATKGSNLITSNEKKISWIISDFATTAQNLKVTSVYTKYLTRSLADRPQQLLWGSGKAPLLPSESEILKKKSGN